MSLIFPSCYSNLLYAKEGGEYEVFLVGRRTFEDGFYEIAISQLEEYLKNYPRSEWLDEVHLLLGKGYYHSGKFYKAKEELQLVHSKRLEDEVLYWTGETHSGAEDYKGAIEFYDKVINNHPDSKYRVYALYSIGWSYFKLKRFDDAVSQFNQVIKDFPDEKVVEDSRFRLSESLYNLKKFDETISSFNAFLKDYPESSRKAEARYFLGEANYYSGNFNQAIAEYN